MNDFITYNDEEITYTINKSYGFIWYRESTLFLPFIKDVIASSKDVIELYHEDIKLYLSIVDDIYNNLPELVICDLPPILDNNTDFYKLICKNGDRVCYNNHSIGFYPCNEEFYLRIYYEENGYDMVLDGDGFDNRYNISNKVIHSDQPFDVELFAKSVRTYIDKYLSCLFSLFKSNNVKSARFN